MRKLKLSSSEPIRRLIAEAVHRSEEHRFVHRLHCLLLVSEGRSCYEVAAWHGENPRTIERWIHVYERKGASGLLGRHAGGRRRRLSREQLARLQTELAGLPAATGYEDAAWSGRLVAHHLAERYGLVLGIRQCQRMLRVTREDAS